MGFCKLLDSKRGFSLFSALRAFWGWRFGVLAIKKAPAENLRRLEKRGGCLFLHDFHAAVGELEGSTNAAGACPAAAHAADVGGFELLGLRCTFGGDGGAEAAQIAQTDGAAVEQVVDDVDHGFFQHQGNVAFGGGGAVTDFLAKLVEGDGCHGCLLCVELDRFVDRIFAGYYSVLKHGVFFRIKRLIKKVRGDLKFLYYKIKFLY